MRNSIRKVKQVVIGVQARSTSERLPGKCFEKIGTKMLLEHVIDACFSAADYCNRYSEKKCFTVDVALLIPKGDRIKERFQKRDCIIWEGSEPDVLDRYASFVAAKNPDYICRITGDCPLIPPFVISKHIGIALVNGYDYLSNVDEECRLTLDGMDCEVISAELLKWLHAEAKTAAEREHVTLRARTNPPPWARRAFTASYFDHSALKLSVDTAEDLDRVRRVHEEVGKKILTARRIYGDKIHRF